MQTRAEHIVFGGKQGFYEHDSALCKGPMRFAVFTPSRAQHGPVPVLYWLAGLTCNEETFVIKAGAQRVAEELGIALVTLDTSPRTQRYPGDDESWDFGLGAGFYVDATEAPWRESYRMRSYVTRELRALVEASFPVDGERRGIFGHSMGGHGALTIALDLPAEYRSCSAFAPIVAPSQVPWGQKALPRYLGEDRAAWARYDTVELLKTRTFPGELLVDQGTSDKFLERELKPELLEAACKTAGQSLRLRRHSGYDHSYYFIATFVEDHLRHHAKALGA
jgi:S-formylglutathione hydrolase